MGREKWDSEGGGGLRPATGGNTRNTLQQAQDVEKLVLFFYPEFRPRFQLVSTSLKSDLNVAEKERRRDRRLKHALH